MYSLSISASMRFLTRAGLGRNRSRSCWVTWRHNALNVRKWHSFQLRVSQNISVMGSGRGEIITSVCYSLRNFWFLTSASRTLCCIFFLDFIIRTMAASISCFLSSSNFCRVSFLSGSDSPCLVVTRTDRQRVKETIRKEAPKKETFWEIRSNCEMKGLTHQSVF